MFKTINQDNATSEVTIAGARSRASSNQDIATLIFRNYDADTSNSYRLATISGRDAFGTSDSNGFGTIVFSTNPTGTTSNILKDQMIITHRGYVGINTLTPQTHLDINGSVSVASNLTAPAITSLQNSFISLSNYTYQLPATSSNGQLLDPYSSNTATFASNAIKPIPPPITSVTDITNTEFIQVYSWINTSNSLTSPPSFLLVNSYLVENSNAELASSNFRYTLRLYNSTANSYLGQLTLSNNIPQINTIPIITSNINTSARSIIELHAKKETTIGNYVRINGISFAS